MRMQGEGAMQRAAEASARSTFSPQSRARCSRTRCFHSRFHGFYMSITGILLRAIRCGLCGNSSSCFYLELCRSEDQTIIERQDFFNTMIVRNRDVQRIRAAKLGRELGNEVVC
ncbi:MAG: hypothetical protein CAPSK01_002489 [Candidatus Accumulibacter vicinus]|uniref:Uncharacterized protein n=1 Tax=Candidatus Accumulibacter vicinus TaxID=2954382 RepID=A0A084XZK7_9PROT|nr:MAG: hypothetical protein CAPSK01_002489 [Candidatus Accumulibacter vicinus]